MVEAWHLCTWSCFSCSKSCNRSEPSSSWSLPCRSPPLCLFCQPPWPARAQWLLTPSSTCSECPRTCCSPSLPSPHPPPPPPACSRSGSLSGSALGTVCSWVTLLCLTSCVLHGVLCALGHGNTVSGFYMGCLLMWYYIAFWGLVCSCHRDIRGSFFGAWGKKHVTTKWEMPMHCYGSFSPPPHSRLCSHPYPTPGSVLTPTPLQAPFSPRPHSRLHSRLYPTPGSVLTPTPLQAPFSPLPQAPFSPLPHSRLHSHPYPTPGSILTPTPLQSPFSPLPLSGLHSHPNPPILTPSTTNTLVYLSSHLSSLSVQRVSLHTQVHFCLFHLSSFSQCAEGQS